MGRQFFLACGWIFLALGCVGIFLPLLPTTPFLLAASYCFSRGSDKLHHWLRTHNWFGPFITDWEEQGVIRPRTKAFAVCSIWVFLLYPIAFSTLPTLLRLALLLIALSVSIFILTRPSRPRGVSAKVAFQELK